MSPSEEAEKQSPVHASSASERVVSECALHCARRCLDAPVESPDAASYGGAPSTAPGTPSVHDPPPPGGGQGAGARAAPSTPAGAAAVSAQAQARRTRAALRASAKALADGWDARVVKPLGARAPRDLGPFFARELDALNEWLRRMPADAGADAAALPPPPPKAMNGGSA